MLQAALTGVYMRVNVNVTTRFTGADINRLLTETKSAMKMEAVNALTTKRLRRVVGCTMHELIARSVNIRRNREIIWYQREKAVMRRLPPTKFSAASAFNTWHCWYCIF